VHKDVFDRLSDVPDVPSRPVTCARGQAPLKLPTIRTYLDSYSFMIAVPSSGGQSEHSFPGSHWNSKQRH
jgi:hypothetical protein